MDKLLLPIYKDLAQPVVKELGEGFGAIGSFLLSPLQWLQYVSDKNKIIIKARLENFAREYTKIDEKDRCEIPSSIGNPAVEQLVIETDEDVSDMFIKLLITSASKKTINLAHPSFVHKLKILSDDEAKILYYFSTLLPSREIPYVHVRMKFNKDEGIDKTASLTGIEKKVDLRFKENAALYVENIASLGILEKKTEFLSNRAKWYEPLMELYEPLRIMIYKKGHTNTKRYEAVFMPGYYVITSYGELFIEACVKNM